MYLSPSFFVLLQALHKKIVKMAKIHYSTKQKLVSSKNYEILLKMPLYVNPFDCYACKINYLVESNINSCQLGLFSFIQIFADC